jgi:hypothetical protein
MSAMGYSRLGQELSVWRVEGGLTVVGAIKGGGWGDVRVKRPCVSFHGREFQNQRLCGARTGSNEGQTVQKAE